MNRREVADLRTRFSVEGLADIKRAFGETAAALNTVRESTRSYAQSTRQAVIDSQAQLTAARDAAKAAREQIDAVRKANAERMSGTRSAGGEFVNQTKRELDAAIIAQKNAQRALRDVRRPRQFDSEATWARYRENREAATAELTAAKKTAAARAEAYRAEVKAAAAAAAEVKAENDAALKAAIADASKKAKAEEQAFARIERASAEARKAEISETRAAADAVRTAAAEKVKVRQAEQRVELEQARTREASAREQRQADQRTARQKAIAARQAALAAARQAKIEEAAAKVAQKAQEASAKAARKAAEERRAAQRAIGQAFLGLGDFSLGLGRRGLGLGARGAMAGARGTLAGAQALPGLVAMGARTSAAVAGIGAAAVRTTAQIGVSLGTRSIATLVALSSQAGRTANAVARIGARTALRGGALGAAAFGGSLALANKATGDAGEYARSTFNYSRSSGLDLEVFQSLSAAAEKFDVDLGDLRGSLIQFQGQIKSAANSPDSDLGKYFSDMGVQVVDSNGKLRSTAALLDEVIVASKRLDGASRIDFLSKAFGEDDSGKLLPLFETLAEDAGYLEKVSARQRQLGSFITNRDLAVAYEYRSATKDIGDAWKGVKLEIASAVGPDISRLFVAAANDLSRNRIWIAAAFRAGFDNTYAVVRDIVKTVRGGLEYGRDNAEMPFVSSILTGLIRVRDAVRVTMTFFREARATIAGDDEAVTEFPWMVTLRDRLNQAVADVKRFAFELRAAISGDDYNVGSAQFPWIFAIKAAIQVAVADAKLQWQDLLNVFSGNAATTALGDFIAPWVKTFNDAKAVVVDFVSVVGKIWEDLGKVWSNFGDRKGLAGEVFNYDLIKSAGDGFYFLATAAKEGWQWFKKVYDVIFDLFRDFFGLNFESIVFFGAFLTFTGTVRVLAFLFSGMKTLLKGIITPIKTVATALGIGGGVAAAGAGAGLAGAISGVGAAATTAGGAALAATGKWAGLAAVFGRIAGLLGGPLGMLLGIGGAAIGAYSLFSGGGRQDDYMAKLAGELGLAKKDLEGAIEQFQKDDVTKMVEFNRRYVADQARLAQSTDIPTRLDDPRRFTYGSAPLPQGEADHDIWLADGSVEKLSTRIARENAERAAWVQNALWEQQRAKAAANVVAPPPNPTAGLAPVQITIDNGTSQESVQMWAQDAEIRRAREIERRRQQ